MSDEHKPPTDDELAEWEGYSAKGDHIFESVIPRLIDEVRRLQTRSFRYQDIVHAICNLVDQYRAVEITKGRGTTIDAVVSDLKAVLANRPKIPTLTLANGTVVRAGDVLVSQHKDINDIVAVVTAVGERRVLAKGVDDPWENMINTAMDWRPWSEVYPDRPVPGGGE